MTLCYTLKLPPPQPDVYTWTSYTRMEEVEVPKAALAAALARW